MAARRCNHDPSHPRLELQVAIPENLPELVRKFLDACARMYTERAKFPQLGNGRGQRRFLFTSPERERRSQRLEAYVLVAKSVGLHMDVLSLRSGKTLRDDSCDAVDEEQMCRETGLSPRRVRRAKRDLIDAGFLTWHQEVKRYCTCDVRACTGVPKGLCSNGGQRKHRSYAAVLNVTMSFFVALGIEVETVKSLQAGTNDYRNSFPSPIVDITLRRERRRAIAQQQHAAKKATAAAEESSSRIVAASAARVARMFERKNE